MHEQIAQALLALHSHVSVLKYLPRTGWLQRGVALPESVAEHVFGVASLALFVGSCVAGLDQSKLLTIALLHDLAEASLGDLPTSARRLLGAPAKHAAERRALEELLSDHPQRREFVALWDEYATAASPEARLIKGLDRIELLAQALAYERAGNRNLDEFWQGASDNWSDEFPLLRALAMELVAAHERI